MTLAIIVTVIIGFFNMITETINRTAISYNLNAIKNNDPPFYNLTASPVHKFMFGIRIDQLSLKSINLNAPVRYFDIILQTLKLSYGQL